jgi:FkbM family methyltransferase|tara:strand:+ start:346 stop:1215 length:870 start_codon:yes stop_codon:yes gene_type:complete
MKKIIRLLAYFGIFLDNLKIHGINYSGVKNSKVLQEFYLNKNTEIEMFIFLKSVNYDSMIDVGAYFGYFSIYFDKIKENSKVVAFEADSDNFTMLKQFINSNKSNVKAFNKAVGDSSGKISFYKPIYVGATKYPSHGQIGDPSKQDNNLYKDKKYIQHTIEMVSLKSIVGEFVQGQTLLKLDIEGYEEKALRSAKDQLTKLQDLDLIVEIMINDTNTKDIFLFLKDCGYSAYLMTNAGLIAEERPLVLPKANQNPLDGKLRTVWKNHFFTKRSADEIKEINLKAYMYNI